MRPAGGIIEPRKNSMFLVNHVSFKVLKWGNTFLKFVSNLQISNKIDYIGKNTGYTTHFCSEFWLKSSKALICLSFTVWEGELASDKKIKK